MRSGETEEQAIQRTKLEEAASVAVLTYEKEPEAAAPVDPFFPDGDDEPIGEVPEPEAEPLPDAPAGEAERPEVFEAVEEARADTAAAVDETREALAPDAGGVVVTPAGEVRPRPKKRAAKKKTALDEIEEGLKAERDAADAYPDEPSTPGRTPTLDEALAHTFPEGFVELPAPTAEAVSFAETHPVQVAIERLRESPTNPRKTFGDLSELTESIRKQGILQPLLVRPMTDPAVNLPYFEIVSGHRRFRAAQGASVASVPVLVRDLDDAEVLEAQLTENLQRSDLSPLEEAEGYEALTKIHGQTAEEIASRVGKSRAYVYGRMKLLELKESGRKALADGRLTASTALLVARIPDEKLQARAVQEITGGDAAGAEPISYRAAALHLQTNYMLRLQDAPFDTKDEFLISEMGACGPCPYRSGNNRDLFGDVERADVCTNPGCFKRKTDAAWSNAREQANAKGLDVMPVAESRKLLAGGAPAWNSGWVELSAIAVDDEEKRTWKKLLGKSAPAITVAQDPSGKVRHLIKRDAAIEAAAGEGHAFAKKASKAVATEEARADQRTETAEQKAQAKLDDDVKKATSLAVVAELVAHVEAKGPTPEVLRTMFKGLEHTAFPDLAVVRRGFDSEAGEAALERFVTKKATGAQLLGLVFEMAIAEWVGNGGPFYSDELKAVARAFKVDLRALEKRERARILAEQKRTEAEKLFAKKGPVELVPEGVRLGEPEWKAAKKKIAPTKKAAPKKGKAKR